jgi:AdoMet-dependent heme synthase
VSHLREITEIVADGGSRLWSVSFLLVTGRAQLDDDLTAEECEQVFDILYRTGFVRHATSTAEAPHYRRYYAQQKKHMGLSAQAPAASLIQRHSVINDGKGLLFVSHTGEIFPSGFLELSASMSALIV